jgi:P27 family predicted phage terminase small subunit
MGGEGMPKRQPIDLVVAKGKKHLTKDEIEKRRREEVRAPSDNIQAPEYLPDDLRGKFDWLAGELQRIGIMANIDAEAVARYIAAESQYQKITTKILRLKTVGPRYFDLLAAQDKIFKQCVKAAHDLGLTISSRCKLVMPKREQKPPESKWSKFGGLSG